MSAILDSALDAERLADIARNDAAMHCLRLFRVLVGPRENPRLDFCVYARSSSEAQERHMDMAQIGERVEVRVA